jgi:hypothetical protein
MPWTLKLNSGAVSAEERRTTFRIGRNQWRKSQAQQWRNNWRNLQRVQARELSKPSMGRLLLKLVTLPPVPVPPGFFLYPPSGSFAPEAPGSRTFRLRAQRCFIG